MAATEGRHLHGDLMNGLLSAEEQAALAWAKATRHQSVAAKSAATLAVVVDRLMRVIDSLPAVATEEAAKEWKPSSHLTSDQNVLSRSIHVGNSREFVARVRHVCLSEQVT